jgi:hypothetical protein
MGKGLTGYFRGFFLNFFPRSRQIGANFDRIFVRGIPPFEFLIV